MIRFLHTRIRVSDLEKTIAFYEKLGFECTRRTDKSPAGNQLAFLELEGNEHFLELCYSPDFEVKFPEDLMHTCVGVDDIIEYCGKLEGDGIEIWPEDWRTTFPSGEKRKMAFRQPKTRTRGLKTIIGPFSESLHVVIVAASLSRTAASGSAPGTASPTES